MSPVTTGLAPALAAAPRPEGDPGAVRAAALAWGSAADAVDRARGGLGGTVAAAAAGWRGVAATAWEGACAEALTRAGAAAQALDAAAGALARFAAELAAAQAAWDAAERAAARDDERQALERARVLVAADAALAQHARAEAVARAAGGPRPDPPALPSWSPDPASPARRAALDAALDARARAAAAARACAAALDAARATAWPGYAAGPPARELPVLGGLRAGEPGAWGRAVSAALLRTLCLPAAGYDGGGWLRGPDGRDYPLVVPFVVEDGVRRTGDEAAHGPAVEDLDGQDPGWRTVATTTGLEHLGGRPGAGLLLAGALAGSAGWTPPVAPRADALPLLRVGPTGWPSLGRAPAPAAPAPPQNPLEVRRGTPPRVLRDGAGRRLAAPPGPLDPAERSAGRGRVGLGAAGASDLATLGLTAAAGARLAGDARARWTVVRFQEHADGRRRALARTYRVEEGRGGPVVRVASLHADPQGRPVERPVAWRRTCGPVLRPAGYAVG
ncbi:hypothetical protein [Vallicoccus soli]|uniref:hypothetical protein n=1 Tax=Vallicoccus soli TaxID=2339232 RepID=UPI0014024FF8|nr:hypothetical protein [Vallicoccus soli]